MSGSNLTVSTEDSHTTIQENVEKESCTTSISGKEQNADEEKEGVSSQETAGNDSGTDERTVDQAVKTENEKSKDDNHSDPETGELEESLLLSVKEPTGDFTDDRKISFGEVLSEPETTAEVGSVEFLIALRRSVITVANWLRFHERSLQIIRIVHLLDQQLQ